MATISADEKLKIKKLMRSFQTTLRGDARTQDRVKAVNTLLNSGHNLKLLDADDLNTIWESIFYALWFAEMGRGCEEIIAAVERACSTSYSLTRIGFQTIAKKWYSLDQHRIDKVSHLARHLLTVLLNHQIKHWLKSCKKGKKLGPRDLSCRRLLKRTFIDVSKSIGLCHFLLEIVSDEIVNTLSDTYACVGITCGKFELKANLIIFLYKQIISFVTNARVDPGLLRTFSQYVIKKLIEEILPNEAQLTQILVSLRLYQALEEYEKKSVTGKYKSSFRHFSMILQDVHERCLNSEYYRLSTIPVEGSIRLDIPRYNQTKLSKT